MPIRKLSPLLINQIAAGEVIERPASVVKELVENSLDAGASRIDVTIEDGGLGLIRISDDGQGIPPDELPLAIAPHATSKLQSAEQLAAIATLGFRGEALASIASVSRLRIISRSTRDGSASEAAAVIEASGDEVSDVQPAATSPGTVMEVRDLFFNVPARRKFMRAASTEFGHIGETITRLAMVHSHVAFTLSHNGRKTMDLIATDSRRQRCVDLLGKELDEALLEFESKSALPLGGLLDSGPRTQDSGLSCVWGLAGLPAIARATSKFQYLCINGRFIRDRSLAHAIKEAYRGLVPPDRQPVAVVFITMDPTLVDVNVHPTKAEVRFRDGNRLHGLVLTAIRGRLLGADLTPSATVTMTGRTLDLKEASEGAAAQSSFYGSSPEVASRGFMDSPASPLVPSHPVTSPASTAAFVDYFRQMAPVQKGFVYQQVREAMAEVDPAVAHDPQPSLPVSSEASSNVPPVLRSFGVLQVHKSYLVTEDEHGILIIDQHALHERVMFEQLRQRVTARNLESQRLLMPAVVRASAKRQALLDALAPLLEKIGIEAEPMGPETVAIHAFPTFLFDRKVDPIEFVTELLDQAEEEKLDASTPTAMEAALHEVLDMMSCKAAVKAGDRLSAEELAALLSKRDEIERASNCPHGRPTTIRLSLRELEKQFKRT
ncbi:MAG: DNA mismatch repair endonuclease MutL [Phycisphaeraceae bacterium]